MRSLELRIPPVALALVIAGALVATGIYRYSRNPKYLGFPFYWR